MLEVQGLCRRFPGQSMAALTDISFSAAERDCIVISGANGSGKSVLMNLIAGLDSPSAGSVTLAQRKGKKVRVGLVFQDADAQILGDTPEEDVAFGPRNLGLDKKECAEITRNMIARVGLAGKEKFPARSLSGGEKRRLAVAGVLAMDAEIIIFDEPFANLDWPGVVQVNEILTRLKEDGKTLIILTHELEKVLALANRIIILFQGKLVYDGFPDEALRSLSLQDWGIRNPLQSYTGAGDLIWKAI
jgi:biotin transport system ATP-binding protein